MVYKLQTEVGDESLFSISTVNGQGVLKLLRPLDYEKKFLYQLRVLAVDRSSDPARVSCLVDSHSFYASHLCVCKNEKQGGKVVVVTLLLAILQPQRKRQFFVLFAD